MIFWIRVAMILILILLGFYIFKWARELYGNKAALLTLFLFSFSPTFLAHGRPVILRFFSRPTLILLKNLCFGQQINQFCDLSLNILPVYLWFFIAPLLVILGFLILWQAASVISIYPHFLAYFNELVGGTDQGYIYTVNSNLDCGRI